MKHDRQFTYEGSTFFLHQVFRDGHAFWVDQQGRISIADQSGSNPLLTDDGILFIDRDKPMTAQMGLYDNLHPNFFVDLIGSGRCILSTEEAVYLNKRFLIRSVGVHP